MASRTLRLLIVDDLEDWRDLLKAIFERRTDIAITEAVSGEDAVEKIKAEDYDLVLLDVRMPSGTEGLDALAEIKKLKPQTNVMMISAYGDIHKAVQAMTHGALDFVPKDLDFDDVITLKVNEFIRTAQFIADRELLIHAKYETVQQFEDAQKKGKALEDLPALPQARAGRIVRERRGFIQIDRNVNTATEEIDIVFRNESREPSWQKESEIILVECKNWKSQRVGKNEFVLFKEKIENRYGRCKLGFLVCTADFSETLEREMLRSSKTDLLVVPLDGDALRQLVEAKNRSRLLRSFVDRALLI